jgi:hypothetical protein
MGGLIVTATGSIASVSATIRDEDISAVVLDTPAAV